ncbi:nucleotidyltransferase domain-containing protein [Candidatus Wolfebacteria bacterium]|nr:nucleotidyltransferase domain-containing protein [Candidatus Wolfebacteria bacterium]
MATQKQIQEIANKIVEKFHPEKIILFGSYAWGNPTENSDVDLFIVEENDKPRRERQMELRSFLFGSPFPYDVLVYTPKESKRRVQIGDFFIRDILNKGKILYER